MAHVRVVPDESGMDELQVYVDARCVRPVTEAVADDMRRFVPVLSGDLKATIREDYSGRARDARGRFTGMVGRVFFGDVAGVHGHEVIVDYHLYVEGGTSKMAAQPYARPALYMEREL